MLAKRGAARASPQQGIPPERRVGKPHTSLSSTHDRLSRERRVQLQNISMKVQQTLAQTWKRCRDSDHAEAKRLIAERGVGLLAVPDELLDIILGYSDL